MPAYALTPGGLHAPGLSPLITTSSSLGVGPQGFAQKGAGRKAQLNLTQWDSGRRGIRVGKGPAEEQPNLGAPPTERPALLAPRWQLPAQQGEAGRLPSIPLPTCWSWGKGVQGRMWPLGEVSLLTVAALSSFP